MLGSERVLQTVVSKWTIKVIHSLHHGTKRHGELRRELGHVSQKMLTQTLRDLENAGLIRRVVYPVVPPRVEYSLTKLGRSFVAPLNTLCRWAAQHEAELQAIAASRPRRRKGAVESMQQVAVLAFPR